MKIVKNSNYIIFSVNNFKKTLFEYFKKDFEYVNLDFFSVNKKEFILLHFSFNNYFDNKNIFINFLNENDVYYNIIGIKYRSNYFEFDFFTELLNESTNILCEDFLFYVLQMINIKKLIQKKIMIFLFFKIFFDFNNLIKCQLYIKQLQK